MANLPLEEIERIVGSRYALTVLAGKRAKELREGAPRLVNTDSSNAIIIALQEILEGKITPEYGDSNKAAAVVEAQPLESTAPEFDIPGGVEDAARELAEELGLTGGPEQNPDEPGEPEPDAGAAGADVSGVVSLDGDEADDDGDDEDSGDDDDTEDGDEVEEEGIPQEDI